MADAIRAGIFNDLGSGSNVDLCVITKDKTESLRPYHVANLKGVKQGSYKFKRGTTNVIKSYERKTLYDVLSTNVKDLKYTENMEIA